MKKLAMTFIACLAMAPFAHAATSSLTNSLLEYEAITSAIGTNPEFQNVIKPSEFIIDIDRITKEIDTLGRVRYQIRTRVPDHQRTREYIAILDVAPNPGIGPRIVTVVNIKPVEGDDC